MATATKQKKSTATAAPTTKSTKSHIAGGPNRTYNKQTASANQQKQQEAKREKQRQEILKRKNAASALAVETSQIQQATRAVKLLDLPVGTFDEYVTLQFMNAWLAATPIRKDGKVVKSKTMIAKAVVREGLPPVQARSRQVHDLLEAAGKAIESSFIPRNKTTS